MRIQVILTLSSNSLKHNVKYHEDYNLSNKCQSSCIA